MGCIPSMPVSESIISRDQRKAATALLRTLAPAAAELGELFARAGHELSLVGGPVRDVFLGKPPADLDLTTDAVPDEVLAIVKRWADKTWTVGIEFGTIGLRKRGTVFEITTYRSEAYQRGSRKPDVRYGRSLERICGGGISRSTRWRRGCRRMSSSTRSAGWRRYGTR